MKKMEFSGITAPLPGGSFDLLELKDRFDKAAAIDDPSKRAEALGKALSDTLTPVEVSYQEEAIKPFEIEQYCPDGHVLETVEGLDGIKRVMPVPIKGEELSEAETKKRLAATDAPKGATEIEAAARAAAPEFKVTNPDVAAPAEPPAPAPSAPASTRTGDSGK